MPLEFCARVREQDMYRFNLYHTYTSVQGILSVAVGIFILAVAIVSGSRLAWKEELLYIAFGVVFLFYMPVSLWFRSRRQVRLSEVLQNPIHYSLQEEGIVVTSPVAEESATLPWEGIYKVVLTQKQLLIYSNRVNAYVIPREAVEAQMQDIRRIFEAHVESYRLRLRQKRAEL